MPRGDTYTNLSSVASDDEFLVWDTSAGTFGNITAANIAGSSALLTPLTTSLSSSIAPPAIFIPAAAFNSQLASNTLTDYDNILGYWSMPDSTTDIVGVTVQVPHQWTEIDVTALLLNPASSTGTVRCRGEYVEVVPGSVPTKTAGSFQDKAMSTQWQVESLDLLTNIAVPSSKRLALNFIRFGAEAADTLTNDLGFVGLLVTGNP